jgi:hypothetical protein
MPTTVTRKKTKTKSQSKTQTKKKNILKTRKAPQESATSLPEGTIKEGWVIKKASNGVHRWIQQEFVELNGFKKFTVNYAAKHIGEPITLYGREYADKWPSRTNVWSKGNRFLFTPNGDAGRNKTIIHGWLRTQKPEIKKNTRFYIDGPLYFYSNKNIKNDGDFIANGLQVDSHNGQVVSDNLMNSELFVRVNTN